MKKTLTIILFITTYLFGFSNECTQTFKEVKLDPNIRSMLGWERVCAHNRLYLYVGGNMTIQERNYICGTCFKQTDNSIGSTLGGLQ